MTTPISHEALAALAALDTCAVSNAIESFDVRLRNTGFTDGSIRCRTPSLPAMAGYAMTLKVRSASPPPKGSYPHRNDWWDQLQQHPAPHVVVIQDMDKHPGTGAFIGEVHAAILQRLGCVGAVTNGALRDLPGVERLGFHMFSGNVSVSHSYVHLIEVGGVVEIGGLQISPGDLLHGDLHGVVRVPLNIAQEIPTVAQRIREQEQEIIEYCRSSHFTFEGLRSLVAASVLGIGVQASRTPIQPEQHLK